MNTAINIKTIGLLLEGNNMYLISVIDPHSEVKRYYEFSSKEKAVLFSNAKTAEGCICTYFMAFEDFIPATMEIACENYLPLKGV